LQWGLLVLCGVFGRREIWLAFKKFDRQILLSCSSKLASGLTTEVICRGRRTQRQSYSRPQNCWSKSLLKSSQREESGHHGFRSWQATEMRKCL
jgi:hypothetical protein